MSDYQPVCDTIEYLRKRYVNQVSNPSKHVHWKNFLDTFEKLIVKDENGDSTSERDQMTPLVHSITSSLISQAERRIVVRHLVKAVAVCKPANGHTPLTHAVICGDIEIVKLLIDNGAIFTIPEALDVALSKRQIECTQLLVSKATDLDFEFACGHTPLTKAVGLSLLQCTLDLINHGADVNKADGNKVTPLEKAVEVDHLGIVQILIDNKANYKNVVDRFGNNLLCKALIHEQYHIAQLLVPLVDISQRSADGRTPLSIALSNLDWQSFDLLIINGADFNPVLTQLSELAKKSPNAAVILKGLMGKSKTLPLISAEPGQEELSKVDIVSQN